MDSPRKQTIFILKASLLFLFTACFYPSTCSIEDSDDPCDQFVKCTHDFAHGTNGTLSFMDMPERPETFEDWKNLYLGQCESLSKRRCDQPPGWQCTKAPLFDKYFLIEALELMLCRQREEYFGHLYHELPACMGNFSNSHDNVLGCLAANHYHARFDRPVEERCQ